MSDFNENNKEEMIYLEKTLDFIKKQLNEEKNNLEGNISSLVASRREMWQEGAHASNDFDKVPEMNHYLFEVNKQNDKYRSNVRRINNYERMLKSPYFGRFDFEEEGSDEVEKIYIGFHNLMDPEDFTIYVYDWRAPISSIFYRNELGKASYASPNGNVSGEVMLKRQYKIQESELKFFFDSSIRINDEILQEVLSRNSSSKMKNIVQTIQKEQDLIIRDTENELLIVQGTAGSGKTSIALHRIAFLLYEGLASKLNSNNVIIISPNDVFSEYISHVLPELGEENVHQTTFDSIISKNINSKCKAETRHQQLEALINLSDKQKFNRKMKSIEFKGSLKFKEILDRLIDYYEHHLIKFKDIYFDGKVVEKKELLKNSFLNNKIGMPAAKRLSRMESMILNKIHPMRRNRLEKIEKIVQKSDDHVFEIKQFSRLISIKEAKVFMDYIREFTEIDYMEVYKALFKSEGLFFKLSKGVDMPEGIQEIILETDRRLCNDEIDYEDSAALLYLKFKLEGLDDFSEIKQVVIDEAQDYYPLQYEIFKIMFRTARYTVLGDFNQSIERNKDKGIYDDISKILDKGKSVKLFMNKSYRSSYEITSFAQRLIDARQEIISFDRHNEEPIVIKKENQNEIDNAIAKSIEEYKELGYESIAVICKTEKESGGIRDRLKQLTEIKIGDINNEIEKGIIVIPAYMAKGLEFDVVIIYDANDKNYKNELDKKLLYVACTRPLHRLAVYYTGKRSRFL